MHLNFSFIVFLEEHWLERIIRSIEKLDSAFVHLVDAELGMLINLVVLCNTGDSFVNHGLQLHLVAAFALGNHSHSLVGLPFSHVKLHAPAFSVYFIEILLQNQACGVRCEIHSDFSKLNVVVWVLIGLFLRIDKDLVDLSWKF